MLETHWWMTHSSCKDLKVYWEISVWKQILCTAVRSVIRGVSTKWKRDCTANDWFKSEPQGSMFTLSPSSPLLRLLPSCFKCLFLSPIFLQGFTQVPTPPWSLHPIKRHPILSCTPSLFTHVNLTQSSLGNPFSLFVNLSIMLLWGHREMPKI